ncbi:hypothetical protein RF55_18228 [Lasius niger]|uniref:Uncharacterized protein n=1 Tax=Lasius niger TaxID=67767 RepID=A0A0J7K1Y4_LASNI|nr:hypothetical protein RF55_18228 [Lasius niger]
MGDQYSKEREKYYNRNGWGILTVEDRVEENDNFERTILERERDVQRQIEDGRIREAKYNREYGEIVAIRKLPKYLEKANLDKSDNGKGILALAKMRCGNMEEQNKYWLEDKDWICVFYEQGWDNLKHFVKECKITKGWFDKLGNSDEERLKRIRNDDLDKEKGEILWKLWKEKAKKMEEIKKKNGEKERN